MVQTVYSGWLVDYFHGHEHCTAYGGHRSSMLSITASIIQGSAIGPATYVVTAADLRTVSLYNLILKYVEDDTYLIIPASNIQSRSAELQNVEQWAAISNLKLNRAKTSEIIITTKGKSKSLQPMPPLLPDIVRVTRLKIL